MAQHDLITEDLLNNPGPVTVRLRGGADLTGTVVVQPGIGTRSLLTITDAEGTVWRVWLTDVAAVGRPTA